MCDYDGIVKVTLKQIAQAANVHYTTVASILNHAGGNSRFSQTTQDRVKQVADKLGYVPNLDAQRLKTNRTMTIGFAAGDIRNPFFAELAIALEVQLQARGYELLLASHSQSNPTEDADLVQKLVGRSVDAMIVWAEGQDTLTPQQVHRQRGKIVWLGWCDGGCYQVHVNVENGLEQITQYLVQQGHQTVGFYSHQPISPRTLTRRQMLFEKIATQHKLLALSMHYAGASWDIQAAQASGKEAWQTILKNDVTAVIAHNDVAAMGLLHSRPAKAKFIAVIGFDGTPMLQCWRPANPYLHYSFEQMAKAAADMAILAAQNKRPPRKEYRHEIQPILMRG